MKTSKKLIAITAITLLAGCATSRSTVDVAFDAPNDSGSQGGPALGKTVYVSDVRDKRTFQENPLTPEIPSLDPTRAVSGEIKLRAIGRKRNTWGKALGDILLNEGTSVETLAAEAIHRAFLEKGYAIVNDPNQVSSSTRVVHADITQFWTWMNPGFWALTISSEIATELAIKQGDTVRNETVRVKSADNFQTGMEENYVQVVKDALRLYVDELKRKLD